MANAVISGDTKDKVVKCAKEWHIEINEDDIKRVAHTSENGVPIYRYQIEVEV